MKQSSFRPEGWKNKCDNIEQENIENCIQYNKTLQGLVYKCDKDYNLYLHLGNQLTGVIPRDEIEGINVDQNGNVKSNLCIGKVNKFVQFKVKELNSKDNIAILSRKEVQKETLNEFKNKLKIGTDLKGIVKSIKPYGAFIEIGGGVVGLAHIEDLSVARIKTPFERLQIGQEVNMKVKDIDRKNGKINLSYKEMLGTWEENADKFKKGMYTTGIVRETEKNKNGIFIELLPNLVGMAEYRNDLRYGQNVNVIIKKIDYDKKKIKLAYY